MTAESTEEPQEEAYFVTRPPETLQLLTPEYRWEFTRRHPYYLMCWNEARRHRLSLSEDSLQFAWDEVFTTILLTIGVTGVPEDPSTAFVNLPGHPLPQVWASGAVAPTTIRNLAGCFLFLPSKVRQAVGRLLLESVSDTDELEQQLQQAYRLMQLQEPLLDQFPSVPLISINLQAPQRAILEAVEAYVRQEKERLGVPEQRRREHALPDYLIAWDLREGWTGACYDGTRERTLREIASSLGVPIETIRNRYNSAFRLITGHDYQPELWDRLFGALKVGGVFGQASPSWRSLRRPRQSRSRQPIPASRLTAGGAAGLDAIAARANQVGASHDDTGDFLLSDIRSMIARSASNAEIIEELDLRDDMANNLIDTIRSRSIEHL